MLNAPTWADRLPTGLVVALHLLPGIAVLGVYAALAPALGRAGVPWSLAFSLAVTFAGLPCMASVLWASRRWGGVRYRKPMPIWLYAALFAGGLVLAFAALFVTAPLCAFLAGHGFQWLPDYLRPDGEPVVPPRRDLVLLALILVLVVDGVAAPVVEELYFRGVLLPRMGAFGAMAPALNAVLFTIQHFWQPFNWPLILLINLPLAYVVCWRQNIYIGMLLHCATNTIGAVIGLFAFLYS